MAGFYGALGYSTPNGSYRPERLARKWFSRKYDWSPMPYSIFFDGGYAIHGSYEIARLGRPASHGCIRLHPQNAAILFALIKEHMGVRRVSSLQVRRWRPQAENGSGNTNDRLCRNLGPPVATATVACTAARRQRPHGQLRSFQKSITCCAGGEILRTGREVLICAPVDFSETGRLFLDWARSPLLPPACPGPSTNWDCPSSDRAP